MNIAGRSIGGEHPPYIIAELSGNHNQSLDRAIALVEAAADAGADAVKLQTYTADTMTLDIHHGEFVVHDKSSLWAGQSLYDLYQQAYTPWEWHPILMKRAKELGLACFSSPFDESAVDFLESLDVPAYKIASFECIDLPLIAKVAATKKPIIISTGMASLGEIEAARNTAKAAGCTDLVLLKCTSTYPASPENSHLHTIPHLKSCFGDLVGLSDHTMGIGVSVAAVALGACVIEKHFTLKRSDGGVDSVFSLEPTELTSLVTETHRAWQSMGQIQYGGSIDEQKSKIWRRSIYITQDLKKGDRLNEQNIRRIRPGLGLAPQFYVQVLGQVLNQDVAKGTPLSWDLIN